MERYTYYLLEHLLFLMRECPDNVEDIQINKRWAAEFGYPVETIPDVLRALSGAEEEP